MAERLHLCQDDFGFWFITRERLSGRLEVIHHADQRDRALLDAERIAERDGLELLVEEPRPGVRPQPVGYRPPEPRRVRA